MAKPNVLVLTGYGINCETESAHAFEKAGAECEIVHINDLISGKKKMSDFDILMFPGGFSYGDDTGSGNAFARKIKNNLWNDILEFIKAEKLIFLKKFGSMLICRVLFRFENTQFYQCCPCGRLLGFFFGDPPCTRKMSLADHYGGFEAFIMIRALLVKKFINGSDAEILLGILLHGLLPLRAVRVSKILVTALNIGCQVPVS